MITALGWFMHKHAAGIYGCRPPESEPMDDDITDKKNCIIGSPPEIIQEQVNEKGRIETYTIIYNRDGCPDYAVIYGKTKKGLRFIARTEDDSDTFEALRSENRIGQKVSVVFDKIKNNNIAHLV